MPKRPRVFGQSEKHKRESRQAYDRERGTAAERGYDWRWTKYSRSFLRRPENRLCKMCLENGLLVVSEVTDHIKPVRYFPELFWDKSNHQGLCIPCNTKKHYEDERLYGKQ